MPYPIAHALIPGFISSQTMKEKKYWLLAAIVGMLPDIDGVYILFNHPLYELLHRVAFHSILIGVLVSVLLTLLLQAKNNSERLTIFIISLLAFCSHILADLLFSNAGVALLLPFSTTEFSLTLFQLYPPYIFDIIIVIIIGVLIAIKQFNK